MPVESEEQLSSPELAIGELNTLSYTLFSLRAGSQAREEESPIVNVGLLFPSFVGVKIPKCVGIKFPNCVGIKIPNVLPESIWDVHARGRGVFYVTGSSA